MRFLTGTIYQLLFEEIQKTKGKLIFIEKRDRI